MMLPDSIEIAQNAHWAGARYPGLREFDIVKVRDKLGAAFGAYGGSGKAFDTIEDRLRGLKLRVPVVGVRARLIPTEAELDQCRSLGEQLARHLTGCVDHKIISMSELLAQEGHHA